MKFQYNKVVMKIKLINLWKMFKMVFAIELVFLCLVEILWGSTWKAHTVTQRHQSPVGWTLGRTCEFSNKLFKVCFWSTSKYAPSNYWLRTSVYVVANLKCCWSPVGPYPTVCHPRALALTQMEKMTEVTCCNKSMCSDVQVVPCLAHSSSVYTAAVRDRYTKV